MNTFATRPSSPRRAAVVVAVLALGGGLLPSSVSAAPHRIGALGFQFVPPRVSIAPGDTLEFTSLDIAPHKLQSFANAPDGRPLFFSEEVSAGQSSIVAGVEKLEPGTYGFFCPFHSSSMFGELTVAETPPIATPVAKLNQPTSIAINGSTLYAASYMNDNVQAFPILGQGLLGAPTTYATGFNNPLGIAFAPDGTLFVADSHASTRPGRTTDGRVWALPPGGGAAGSVGQVVIDLLPNGRHNTNGMAVHGGRLFITNGNSTDDGVAGGPPEELLSGTVISVPLAARGLTPADLDPEPREPGDPDDLLLEAHGMRNPFDIAFRPGTNEAWIPTNGPDQQDPFGEDLLHRAFVSGPSPDFGFPACVYRAGASGPEVGQNPAVAATKKCGAHTPPEALLGLHTSANGLAFGSGGAYWGDDLFVALFGANGGGAPGHKLIRVPIDGTGNAGTPRDVIASPSPLDVTFGSAGLYVADFLAGTITLLRAPAS